MARQSRIKDEDVQIGMIDRNDREVLAISERGFYMRKAGYGGRVDLEKRPNAAFYSPKRDIVVLGFPIRASK